ncbi:efflux RND transporter periplasmic adaptor subunit [Pseudomonas jilinensis]|uniref:RND transporter n=1 Tax=Pseudomonas jilinensis TaxID=2078689 RepID=A0A396RYG7_9PSED|nr:HlyD family efflux transporter periplasmic adaptor subunit [Pseudomonas jilinensis]RHW21296.1 RND transporter [Pseudomonas jilinensis]
MRKRLIPILIIIFGLAVFLLLRLTRDVPDPVAPQERSWRVDVVDIRPDTFQPSLTLYGQIESPLRFTVVAPLAGRIAELPVRDGQQVSAGELLVALDEADILPRLQQARADLADAEAQLASEASIHSNDRQALELEKRIQGNAQKALERMRQLVERQLAPHAELDNAEDVLERAALTVANRQRNIDSYPSRRAALQARLERARATLESMERDAQRSRFSAPFDGVVSQVQVAVGDQVNANAALLALYPLDGLELRATLPQTHSQAYIDALARGERLQARSLETQPPLTLTLERIAGQADPRGVDAIFTLDQPTAALRVGNLLAISVSRPNQPDSVALPYSALYGNDTIYAVNDQRLQRIQVERLGETHGPDGERRVLLRSPQLQAGMRIVVTHLPNAMPGLKVDTGEAAVEPEA